MIYLNCDESVESACVDEEYVSVVKDIVYHNLAVRGDKAIILDLNTKFGLVMLEMLEDKINFDMQQYCMGYLISEDNFKRLKSQLHLSRRLIVSDRLLEKATPCSVTAG